MGPLMYDEGQEEVFLGRSASSAASHISSKTLIDIDAEVRRIVDGCYATATRLLQENRDKLDKMADSLMLYETIDADQIEDIMSGNTARRPANWEDDDSSGGGEASSKQSSSTGSDSIGGPAGEH